MIRGEVWWADLGPHRFQEQTGRRPVVIWQSNALSRALHSVLVVPLTTNLDRAKLARHRFHLCRGGRSSHRLRGSRLPAARHSEVGPPRSPPHLPKTSSRNSNSPRMKLWVASTPSEKCRTQRCSCRAPLHKCAAQPWWTTMAAVLPTATPSWFDKLAAERQSRWADAHHESLPRWT